MGAPFGNKNAAGRRSKGLGSGGSRNKAIRAQLSTKVNYSSAKFMKVAKKQAREKRAFGLR
jgi:hypothetical protein